MTAVPEERAEYPRDGRVEDEAWLTCTPIRALRPMGIQDALAPGALHLKPGVEMEVEIMTAGDAAYDSWQARDERGEGDQDRAVMKDKARQVG